MFLHILIVLTEFVVQILSLFGELLGIQYERLLLMCLFECDLSGKHGPEGNSEAKQIRFSFAYYEAEQLLAPSHDVYIAFVSDLTSE